MKHVEESDGFLFTSAGKLDMPSGRCLLDTHCQASGSNNHCLPFDEAVVQLGMDAIPGGTISKQPICWCKDGNDTCATDYGVCQEHTPCLVRLWLLD